MATTKNLVSASLTDEKKTVITQAVETIKTNLPFLIALSDKERKGGMKLGDKSFGFAEKATGYIHSSPQFAPAYLNVLELDKDYQLLKDLQDILRIISPLTNNIEDTATECGIEAISACMVYYHAVKDAAARGVEGAKPIYDDLQKRFPGSSGNSAEDDATTTTK